MTIVPPDPGTDPRGTAVPLAGMSPRRRPPELVEPDVKEPLSPPLEPELELPPELEPPPPQPHGLAVPPAGAPPLLVCCAEATTGNARAPTTTADRRDRVIRMSSATRLPIREARKQDRSSHDRLFSCHLLNAQRLDFLT